MGQAVGKVRRAAADEPVGEVALTREEAHGDELGLVGQQPLDAGEADRPKLSLDLHLRRTSHR